MQRLICTVIVVSITSALFAQKRFDVFYLGGNYNFMQPTEVNKDNHYEESIVSNLSVPIVLKDSSVWISIVDYQHYSIKNEYLPTDSAPVERFNLHGFFLRTGYIHRFNSTQSVQVFFVPRVMTDLKSSFSESVQFGGILMYEKINSHDFTWRVGVLYNQEFFGPFITPVFYADWNIGNKIKFTGLLPVYGKLYAEVSEKFSAGLHFAGLTTSYRINEYGFENYYVERNSIDVSVFSNFQLVKNIFLEGRIGYSLNKDYSLYDETQKVTLRFPLISIGDNRTRANSEYEGSPFVHLRLTYSLPIK